MPTSVAGDVIDTSLEFTDRPTAELLGFHSQDVYDAKLIDLIRLGALITRNSGASASIEAIAQTLSRTAEEHRAGMAAVASSVNSQIQIALEAYLGNDGAVKRSVSEATSAIAALIETKLDPDTAGAAKKLLERIETANDAMRKGTIEHVTAAVNINDEKAPLGQMDRKLAEVAGAVIGIKSQLDGVLRVAQERSVSTAKGVDLEAFVSETLAPLASIKGEVFDDVRHDAGAIPGSKKGDFVAELHPRVTRGRSSRVVIEAKNRKISVKKLCAELADALENRDARTALGILTSANAGDRPIAAYENKYVVVSLPGFGTPDANHEFFRSLLQIGYDYARLLALAAVTGELPNAIDFDAIGFGIERLEGALGDFSQLSAQHTAIESAVGKARDVTGSIKSKVTSEIKGLRLLIQSAAQAIAGRSDAKQVTSSQDAA